MIVECGDVQATDVYRHLIQEAVVVSKKKLIMTTLHPKMSWEPIMIQQMCDSPLSAVTSIRMRKALNLLANVWLKPSLTDAQKGKAKQRAALANRPAHVQAQAALQMQLRVEGPAQIELVTVCQELMAKVCEVTKYL